MARDYYSILSRATAVLDPDTAEARRAAYDRARLAIMDAGLSAAETTQERVAIEEAIGRIEAARTQGHVPPAAPNARQLRRAEPPRPRRTTVRAWPMVLAAAAMALVIAVILWPRGSVTDRDAGLKRADARGVEAASAGSAKSAGAPAAAGAHNASGPSYILKRQLVYYRSIHPAGTVVIAKSQRFLYLVRPDIVALRYTIAVGRECSNAIGLLLVSAKDDGVKDAQPPARLASAGTDGGRLASRSLALGDTGHRIYGTDPPLAAAQNGCFALVNEDVMDLYERVSVGTRVVIN
jgi:lipoprotein-anchoring transpeptidase ErfK/SrfK